MIEGRIRRNQEGEEKKREWRLDEKGGGKRNRGKKREMKNKER